MEISLIPLSKNQMKIETIKDLKKAIDKFPDDMLIKGYKGGNGDLHTVYGYDNKKWMSKEEIERSEDPYTYILDID